MERILKQIKFYYRNISPILTLHGPHVEQLKIGGLLRADDIGHIAETCPNLRWLSFTVASPESPGLQKLKVIY